MSGLGERLAALSAAALGEADREAVLVDPAHAEEVALTILGVAYAMALARFAAAGDEAPALDRVIRIGSELLRKHVPVFHLVNAARRSLARAGLSDAGATLQ